MTSLEPISDKLYHGKFTECGKVMDVLVKVTHTNSKAELEVNLYRKCAGINGVLSLIYVEKQGTSMFLAFPYCESIVTLDQILKSELTDQERFIYIKNLIKIVVRCYANGLSLGDIGLNNFLVYPDFESQTKTTLKMLLCDLDNVNKGNYTNSNEFPLCEITICKTLMQLINPTCNLYPSTKLHYEYGVYEHLMIQMTKEPMPCNTVTKHPFFWAPSRTVNFFHQVHEFHCYKSGDQRMENVMKDVQGRKQSIIGCDNWIRELKRSKLDHALYNAFSFGNGYDGNDIKDLIRYLRNCIGHYNQKPPKAKKALKPIPEGLLNRMLEPFPKLFVEMYNAIEREYGKKFECDFLDYV